MSLHARLQENKRHRKKIMHEALIIAILIVGAYLIGSIPTAVWVGKIFFKIDIREHGSGNAGATNVLRVFGTAAAIPVFVIDAMKGYGAVMLSWFSALAPASLGMEFSESFTLLRVGLLIAAIVGHIFPIFASFRGGKGMATITGGLIAVTPLPLLACFIVFVVAWSITSYLSLGSVLAVLGYPLWVILRYIIMGESISPTMVVVSILISTMLLYTHRENIKRLRAGTESKTYLFRK